MTAAAARYFSQFRVPATEQQMRDWGGLVERIFILIPLYNTYAYPALG